MKAVREERRETLEKVKSEFDKEKPDMEGTIAYLKEASRNRPDLMAEWLDYFKEFYDILDDEQKAKLSGMIKEQLNRRRPW
jgi:Spy/CpxP family protein refolding chaperone